jgi:hypothetical protein
MSSPRNGWAHGFDVGLGLRGGVVGTAPKLMCISTCDAELSFGAGHRREALIIASIAAFGVAVFAVAAFGFGSMLLGNMCATSVIAERSVQRAPVARKNALCDNIEHEISLRHNNRSCTLTLMVNRNYDASGSHMGPIRGLRVGRWRLLCCAPWGPYIEGSHMGPYGPMRPGDMA